MKNLILALLIVSCSQVAMKQPSQNVVLIQGVHLDGAVWDEVKTKLSQNLKVTDLGRLGRDGKTPASLKSIAEESCEVIPMASVIVGHSYGGAITNAIAGICPEKISKIIYVTALVPLAGEKPFDLMNKTDNANYSKIVTFGRFKIIPKEAIGFFNGSDPTVPMEKLPLLHPEWTTLGSEAIKYDEEKFSAIPKAYIYTEKDPILSLTTQFQYTSRTGIKNVEGLQTGHFPMLSNPEKLAQLINKWAVGL